MAASPPRFEKAQVTHLDNSRVAWTDSQGNNQSATFETLSNVELSRVCSMKFEQVNGKAWFHATKDEKVAALKDGHVPDSVQPYAATGTGDTLKVREAKPTPPKVFEAKAEASGGGSIEQAITALVESVAGGVIDEDRVRKIAADVLTENVSELLEQVTRPQVNEFTFQGLPTVTIERRVHEVLPSVLRSLSVGDHVWLVGPAGTGKSTIGKDAAEALGLPFYSISCHGQMTAAQVFGYMNATGEYVPSLFRVAFEQGGVFLFDEIDSASSNVLAAVNQALSNGHCAFPDGMVAKSDRFYCIGAGNTFGKGATAEYSGRAKIDEATIDRFDYLFVDYDEAIEAEQVKAILPAGQATDWLATIAKFRKNIEANNLKVILGARSVICGARLLAAGETMENTLSKRVFRGASADLVRKIRGI